MALAQIGAVLFAGRSIKTRACVSNRYRVFQKLRDERVATAWELRGFFCEKLG
jgi:hypothetical protein